MRIPKKIIIDILTCPSGLDILLEIFSDRIAVDKTDRFSFLKKDDLDQFYQVTDKEIFAAVEKSDFSNYITNFLNKNEGLCIYENYSGEFVYSSVERGQEQIISVCASLKEVKIAHINNSVKACRSFLEKKTDLFN